MSDIPAMLLWTDAYASKTDHLTTLEHGAYFLILKAMWNSKGYLPNDEVRLSRIAKLTLDKWRKISKTIMEFMTIEGSRITQNRLKLEFEIASGKMEKAREAGRAGGRAKSLKKLQSTSSDAKEMPIANGKQSSSNIYSLPETSNQSSSNEEQSISFHSIDLPKIEKSKKQSRAKSKTPMTENMQPSLKSRNAAHSAGLSKDEFRHEWAMFRDYHLKEGKMMADWDAAWRTWLGNRKKFQPIRHAISQNPEQITDTFLLAAASMIGELNEPELNTVDESLFAGFDTTGYAVSD